MRPVERTPLDEGSAANRFLARVTAREGLMAAGVASLGVCALLSPPVATPLLSLDGESLGPAVVDFLERIRLAAGLVGTGLLLGSQLRGLAGRTLPVSRGAVLLGAAASLGALLLGEGFARYRGYQEWGSATRTPLSLSAMRPPGEPWLRPGVYLSRLEDHFRPEARDLLRFTIQGFGVRGSSPSGPGPTEKARIVCIGGSTTFGYSVNDGEEWPAILEDLLGARMPVEVINAGRPGATTWSNHRLLRDRLLPLEPDVVVFYEGFNDMWRGVRRHAAVQEDYGLVEEGAAAVPEPFDLGPPRAWPRRLSFVAFRAGRALENRLDADQPRPVPPVDALFDPGIVSLFESNLAAMVRLSRQGGALPVIATFAGCDDPGQESSDLETRLRYVRESIPPLSGRVAVAALDLYRERTRAVAAREEATLIDLARLVPPDTSLFTDTVHLTRAGERLVAERVAEGLLAAPEIADRLASYPHDPERGL